MHLHKHIECIKTGNPRIANTISNDVVGAYVSVFVKYASNAMCFDMGKMDDYVGMKAVLGLCDKLPFEPCWFEFINGGQQESIGVLCTQRESEIIFLPVVNGIFFHHVILKNSGHIHSHPNNADFAKDITDAIMVFLSILNCKNVKTEEVKPDAALQKARAKRGKMPLFSYHVLTLRSDTPEKGDSKGGTHASPRLHIRRGHIRRFDDGTHTWVSPCTVGDKKLGMVHKDYKYQAATA